MAQTGKNKLRRWEFPAGSGINIRELINRWKGADRGVSYLRGLEDGGVARQTSEAPVPSGRNWHELTRRGQR
jgi:hypothetical protein